MKITIIGGGNMGGAIAKGLAVAEFVSPKEITVINRREENNPKFEKYGIHAVTGDYASIASANVVILAIKPWLIKDFIDEHAILFAENSGVIISIAARIGLDSLEEWLGRKEGVYFVIPNTAIEVGESFNLIASNSTDGANDKIVMGLFSKLGKAYRIEESKIDAAMVLCSCGIAFAMRYIRASMEAGIEMGLPSAFSKTGILQTLKGAVALLEATGSHPEEEIDKVTTPGGITIKGINELEHNGFSSAIIKALKACK